MALYLINIFQRERDRLLLEIKKLACVPYVQNKKMQDVYSDKLNDLELQVGWYYNIDIFKIFTKYTFYWSQYKEFVVQLVSFSYRLLVAFLIAYRIKTKAR